MSELSKELLTEKLKYISEFAINFDKRIIYVFGELNEDIGTNLRIKYDLLKQWWDRIEQKEFTDITLDIASYGGQIYSITAALDFYYELGLEGITVHTKAQGICMSAATVLLSGGTGTRMATPRCKFMLHDMQIDGVGGTASQVQNTVKNITSEQEEMFQLYAEFARKGKEPLTAKELKIEGKKWMKRFTKNSFDHYLTSDEAKELNLIDKII
jgi:ATP-dependent protease ClpP protease subunit